MAAPELEAAEKMIAGAELAKPLLYPELLVITYFLTAFPDGRCDEPWIANLKAPHRKALRP
jgi:hypothetical protein